MPNCPEAKPKPTGHAKLRSVGQSSATREGSQRQVESDYGRDPGEQVGVNVSVLAILEPAEPGSRDADTRRHATLAEPGSDACLADRLEDVGQLSCGPTGGVVDWVIARGHTNSVGIEPLRLLIGVLGLQ